MTWGPSSSRPKYINAGLPGLAWPAWPGWPGWLVWPGWLAGWPGLAGWLGRPGADWRGWPGWLAWPGWLGRSGAVWLAWPGRPGLAGLAGRPGLYSNGLSGRSPGPSRNQKYAPVYANHSFSKSGPSRSPAEVPHRGPQGGPGRTLAGPLETQLDPARTERQPGSQQKNAPVQAKRAPKKRGRKIAGPRGRVTGAPVRVKRLLSSKHTFPPTRNTHFRSVALPGAPLRSHPGVPKATPAGSEQDPSKPSWTPPGQITNLAAQKKSFPCGRNSQKKRRPENEGPMASPRLVGQVPLMRGLAGWAGLVLAGWPGRLGLAGMAGWPGLAGWAGLAGWPGLAGWAGLVPAGWPGAGWAWPGRPGLAGLAGWLAPARPRPNFCRLTPPASKSDFCRPKPKEVRTDAAI